MYNNKIVLLDFKTLLNWNIIIIKTQLIIKMKMIVNQQSVHLILRMQHS